MCIIIASPEGVTVPKWELQNSWNNNNDGAGFMYVDEGQVKIVKELKSFDKFYKLYRKHLAAALSNKSPVVLHFRIGTHGTKEVHNVHPFRVNENLAFCHNGVLTSAPNSKKFSDTVMYNKHWLRKLPKYFWLNETIMNLLAEHIGTSKFVMLDDKKRMFIVNKELGEVDARTGTWYSNQSYRTEKTCWRGHSHLADYDDDDVYSMWERGYNTGAQTKLALPEQTPKNNDPFRDRIATCDMCNSLYQITDLVPLSDETSMTVMVCKTCKKKNTEFIAKTCINCSDVLDEEDEVIEMSDATIFCSRCAEELHEMGVLSYAA